MISLFMLIRTMTLFTIKPFGISVQATVRLVRTEPDPGLEHVCLFLSFLDTGVTPQQHHLIALEAAAAELLNLHSKSPQVHNRKHKQKNILIYVVLKWRLAKGKGHI